ncbi:PREDICTED: probable E3 ubiquitin-protein ligase RHG1A isoform X2 [Tarenaya hassleriana]|uniref:probable E3 ubiquitin-protein ligase RHG1A isoform X2 n=1 Tax=Tarenaya hassleriana TaxID=28532 RepID=UPI00053C17A0|nr:PREDICTED: probable E3 ubiquitin-protein ligase RHG1A isoform X2 [Tarenaya hassleriana]
MQGERASLGSLSESLNFEHGSTTSSNAVVDQQIRWEDIRSLGDNDLQDYMISSADTNTAFANSVYHGQQDLHRFNLGEASSSGTENEVASQVEQRPELECFEERRHEKFVEHPGDMAQVMGHPSLFDTNGAGSRFLSPGMGFEESSSRAGSSLEGRRVSCKRKTLEGSIGQSSSSGCFRAFQRGESSSWTTAPTFYSPGSGLNISGSLDQHPRGLVSGIVPNIPVPAIAERSSRRLCIRVTPSGQQEIVNPAVFSAGSVVRRPVAPSMSISSRLLPVDQQHLYGLTHGHALGSVVSQSPNAAAPRMPPNSRNMLPPFRWSGGSVPGASSSSVAPIDRNVIQRDESRSRSISRNILGNPLFVPATEPRNLARSHVNRNVTTGNPNIPGNIVSSSSSTGASAGGQPLSRSNPAWNPPYPSNSPQYQRRFSGLVRRTLLSSVAGDGSSQRAGDDPTLRSLVPPASPDDPLRQSGGDNSISQAHNRGYPRQGDGAIGIPHTLRFLASTSRGRNRFMTSEILNALDIVRRGDTLRYEDFMLLDQSVPLRAADSHDRHRDMRLDVDNMSYEELLALEERIGDVCTGLSEETISNRLKRQKFKSSSSSSSRLSQETEPCCVCQEEYKEGEDVGTLECGHCFHSECIKEWLKMKNICPICKTTGLKNTSGKRTG